jgi:hypothetical protein
MGVRPATMHVPAVERLTPTPTAIGAFGAWHECLCAFVPMRSPQVHATILLIDDQADVRTTRAAALRRQG